MKLPDRHWQKSMCNTSIAGVPSSQGSAVLLDVHEIWIRFPSWRDVAICLCMTNEIFDKYRLSFTNIRCLNSEIPPYHPNSQGSAVLLDFHEIWIRFPSWRDVTICLCMTNVIFDKYRLSFTNNRCLNIEIPPCHNIFLK